MPKRTPGGRVRKTQRETRRPAAVRPPIESDESTPLSPKERAEATHPVRSVSTPMSGARERAEVTHPSRVAPTSGSGRQSLLTGVRRPVRATGPTLITDYSYVMSDLRRIGILAGSAFLILIALTFVIR